ncbi:MAG: hypothetical protein K6C99_10305 [Lachnospiraceae bacterium]|nr:hypothetical protein [Lachnospiraceae bacterium]
MKKRLVWGSYAARRILDEKLHIKTGKGKCAGRVVLDADEASDRIRDHLNSKEPFMAGRLGLFETAVMRMYEFEISKKYALTMDNLYNCAGFFPNDINLGGRFNEVMKDALKQTDVFARNTQFLEDYFIAKYLPGDSSICRNFGVFDVFDLKDPWSSALAGRKVLVVSPFTESISAQYARRELLFKGTDILPEFELKTYRSLLTVGDLRDDRFSDWFEALDHMKREILEMDFDVALLGCGAYGFPLAAEIKKSGRQAIHMGGVLQILFGVMGKRWDGSRFGGIDKMPEGLKRYYNDAWIYPLEGKPKEAGKVEYGPYWN